MPPTVPSAAVGPRSSRLRAVRWAALAACIATLLGEVIPMWIRMRQSLGLASDIGKAGAIAVISIACLFAAIVPAFCFALYCDEGDVVVSRNTRWVAIATAAVLGVLAAAALPEWIGSFGRETVLDSGERRWGVDDTSVVLAQISDLALILLLAALARCGVDRPSERGVAVSRPLRLLTVIAVIVGGIVAVCCVVGVAVTPWVYHQVRSTVGSADLRGTFGRLAVERVARALRILSLYVAPFVVWRGTRGAGESGSG